MGRQRASRFRRPGRPPSNPHAQRAIEVAPSDAFDPLMRTYNPDAQRGIEGKKNGAKIIVFDTHLSNTATHADQWLAPLPGSVQAITTRADLQQASV